MLVASSLKAQIIGQQKRVDLRCQTGRMIAIVGPNGAGKSTLLRALSGVISPEQGRVALASQDIRHYASAARAMRFALLSQSTPLCFDFLVDQVAALGLYIYPDYTESERQALIGQALQLVDMIELRNRTYTSLSQGEQQRVQLARVLLQLNLAKTNQPTFLMLDEPTAHLDIRVQHQICRLVRTLLNPNFGVIMVVHDINLAWQYADQVVLLQQGQVFQQGPVSEVLTVDHIQQLFSVEIAQMNLPNGQIYFCVTGR